MSWAPAGSSSTSCSAGTSVPVLIHDETLQRTTDGRGRVAAAHRGRTPLPRCRQLVRARVRRRAGADPGGGGGPAARAGPARERRDQAGRAVCELRTGEVVADTLRRLWPEDGPRLLLSSFEREALVPARAPGCRTYRAACSLDPARRLGGRHAGARLHHAASGPRPSWRLAAAAWLDGGGRAAAALHRQRASRAPASCSPPAPRPCSPMCRICCSPAWPLSSAASGRPGGPGS